MHPAEEKERRGIQSIEVGGKILVALADAKAPMTLKQLAEAAEMTPAKAHPYLVSYGNLGLVTQDPVSGRYGLGALALRMGLACLRQLNPVRLAMSAAVTLGQRIHQTVALSVWGSGGPTVIHLEESSHPIHMNLRAGTLMSMSTATGMVFGAYMPAKTIQTFVAHSMRPDNYTHVVGDCVDWQDLQAGFQEVREHGMARVVGRPIPGVSAFAAPVFDHDGNVALVVTTLGPTGGFDSDWNSENARILRETANEISAGLGFSATGGK